MDQNSSGIIKNRQDRLDRINSLAEEALKISRGRILANLRYLDSVIYALRPVRASYGFATDGKYIYYDSVDLLKRCRIGITTLSRDYMHILLHCLFRHSFVREPINHKHWDLVSDMAAESLIDSMNLDCFDSPRGRKVHEYLDQNRDIVNSFTAEKLYGWFQDGSASSLEMKRIQRIFKVDDHTMWYDHRMSQTYTRDVELKSSDHSSNGRDQNGTDMAPDDLDDPTLNDLADQLKDQELLPEVLYGDIQNELEQGWKEMSERIQDDLSGEEAEQGMGAGIMKQALDELNREHYDYDSFLRKFAVRGEAIGIDPDSFDYIFYTYGLKLYGNIPLIEPLEYSEENKIRDFVIAVDTSGSTKGATVEAFLKKTFNILKSGENFHKKVNIHIIQCDSKIQDDTVIHSVKDIDEYMNRMEIKGLGGTDFRPVFTYVDALIRQGAFDHLKGLIYFTDGYGVFPRKKPEYETAFVFVDSAKNNLEVPPWAMKIVLGSEEIIQE